MYSAGRIRGSLHLYIGEKAVAVGVMQALTAEEAIVATYRERPPSGEDRWPGRLAVVPLRGQSATHASSSGRSRPAERADRDGASCHMRRRQDI
jgi:TPP-dependent pyruvate/acetoin dehydrogenase alpha subunit